MHQYIIGRTGHGKSTYLEQLALDTKGGFLFLDSHGDSAERLGQHVSYWGPADGELGFNPLKVIVQFELPTGKQKLTNHKPFRPMNCSTRPGSIAMDMSVLVVDNSRTMTKIMCNSLQQIGFTDIDRVHDGASALDHLRAKRYGLVLSDWEMQPMNGPQLIERMRNDLGISNIPVILVTAKHDQDQSWLAGGDGYIVKPFTAHSLREKIEEVMAQHRTMINSPS